jgi:hypothetical protein
MTLFAVGSRYYGYERSEEGYICTEWATFLYIPLFPVASYFVRSDYYELFYINKLPKGVEIRRLEHIHRPHIIAGYTATGFVLIALLLLPYFFE